MLIGRRAACGTVSEKTSAAVLPSTFMPPACTAGSKAEGLVHRRQALNAKGDNAKCVESLARRPVHARVCGHVRACARA
eukprot:6186159-Pleurochrysis_carterae.AAC.5